MNTASYDSSFEDFAAQEIVKLSRVWPLGVPNMYTYVIAVYYRLKWVWGVEVNT